MPRPSTVLLLSGDPMAAALLGLLAETAGFEAACPLADEPPEDAVARVRPLSVILVDSALDVTRSDLFFGRVARRRVALAVLRRADAADLPLAAWARDRDVP
ncbi:MAG TPA: hypothetical protein VFX39_03210, partial [Gemmatimonadaceae bacterium]|nr:hypothetical protein [Gemmatimonadaceae bacterium]